MSQSPLVRIEQVGNVLIITPLFTFGTLTEADMHAEWAVIERRLRDPGVVHATIDFAEIPYFGSTVLEWMVNIWKRISARNGRVAVCNCSEVGREVLATARFDTVWQICDDRAGAMSTFA
jgi:anti-anti-sigma regulatory factor